MEPKNKINAMTERRDFLLQMNGRALTSELKKHQAVHDILLYEATLDLFDFDPVNAGEWPGRDGWPIIGTMNGMAEDSTRGLFTFTTEQEHRDHRVKCRELCFGNVFAINGVENYVSYVVGTGFTYTIKVRDRDAERKLHSKAMQAQEVLDEFMEFNKWNEREQEMVRRDHRDGESMLRFFPAGDDEPATVRFMEPGPVQNPKQKTSDANCSFGIQYTDGDVESVEGYWVNENMIPAEEVVHSKRNVDKNVLRGVSTFWASRPHLIRAERLLRTMSVIAQIQASIAMVRKHQATKPKVESFVSGQADINWLNKTTGKDQRGKAWAPGRIIDAPQGTEYEFPAAAVAVDKLVEAIQAELRAAGARMNLPEWMLSSRLDAKYSNAFAAEGPTVKMFEREQSYYKKIFACNLIERVVAPALGMTEEEFDGLFELHIVGPKLEVRDPKADAETKEILSRNNILSPQTWAAQVDLDYEQEQRNLVEHTMDTGGAGDNPIDEETPIPSVIPPGGPMPVGGGGETVIQDTGLNGAQITALIELVNQLAAKELPPAAVEALVQISFPMVKPELVTKLLTSLKGFTPPKPPEPTSLPGVPKAPAVPPVP